MQEIVSKKSGNFGGRSPRPPFGLSPRCLKCLTTSVSAAKVAHNGLLYPLMTFLTISRISQQGHLSKFNLKRLCFPSYCRESNQLSAKQVYIAAVTILCTLNTFAVFKRHPSVIRKRCKHVNISCVHMCSSRPNKRMSINN